MKQHALTHKSEEIAAAASAARAAGRDDGLSPIQRSMSDREDSNSSPLIEVGAKRSPGDSPLGDLALMAPLPKRQHGEQLLQ
jgi:hypothetical protein